MEERIKYLTDLLVEAWEMYDLGTPIMSDRQWDEYFFELFSNIVVPPFYYTR